MRAVVYSGYGIIGLEDAGRALAAMDGPAEGTGMTVIRLRP